MARRASESFAWQSTRRSTVASATPSETQRLLVELELDDTVFGGSPSATGRYAKATSRPRPLSASGSRRHMSSPLRLKQQVLSSRRLQVDDLPTFSTSTRRLSSSKSPQQQQAASLQLIIDAIQQNIALRDQQISQLQQELTTKRSLSTLSGPSGAKIIKSLNKIRSLSLSIVEMVLFYDSERSKRNDESMDFDSYLLQMTTTDLDFLALFAPLATYFDGAGTSLVRNPFVDGLALDSSELLLCSCHQVDESMDLKSSSLFQLLIHKLEAFGLSMRKQVVSWQILPPERIATALLHLLQLETRHNAARMLPKFLQSDNLTDRRCSRSAWEATSTTSPSRRSSNVDLSEDVKVPPSPELKDAEATTKVDDAVTSSLMKVEEKVDESVEEEPEEAVFHYSSAQAIASIASALEMLPNQKDVQKKEVTASEKEVATVFESTESGVTAPPAEDETSFFSRVFDLCRDVQLAAFGIQQQLHHHHFEISEEVEDKKSPIQLIVRSQSVPLSKQFLQWELRMLRRIFRPWRASVRENAEAKAAIRLRIAIRTIEKACWQYIEHKRLLRQQAEWRQRHQAAIKVQQQWRLYCQNEQQKQNKRTFLLVHTTFHRWRFFQRTSHRRRRRQYAQQQIAVCWKQFQRKEQKRRQQEAREAQEQAKRTEASLRIRHFVHEWHLRHRLAAAKEMTKQLLFREQLMATKTRRNDEKQQLLQSKRRRELELEHRKQLIVMETQWKTAEQERQSLVLKHQQLLELKRKQEERRQRQTAAQKIQAFVRIHHLQRQLQRLQVEKQALAVQKESLLMQKQLVEVSSEQELARERLEKRVLERKLMKTQQKAMQLSQERTRLLQEAADQTAMRQRAAAMEVIQSFIMVQTLERRAARDRERLQKQQLQLIDQHTEQTRLTRQTMAQQTIGSFITNFIMEKRLQKATEAAKQLLIKQNLLLHRQRQQAAKAQMLLEKRTQEKSRSLISLWISQQVRRQREQKQARQTQQAMANAAAIETAKRRLVEQENQRLKQEQHQERIKSNLRDLQQRKSLMKEQLIARKRQREAASIKIQAFIARHVLRHTLTKHQQQLKEQLIAQEHRRRTVLIQLIVELQQTVKAVASAAVTASVRQLTEISTETVGRKRTGACIKIQAHWRGTLARQHVQRMRETAGKSNVDGAATQIQAHWRAQQARSLYRHEKRRQERLHELKEQAHARKIQREWRRHELTSKRIEEDQELQPTPQFDPKKEKNLKNKKKKKQEESAVVQIQSCWRGSRVRQQTSSLKLEYEELEVKKLALQKRIATRKIQQQAQQYAIQKRQRFIQKQWDLATRLQRWWLRLLRHRRLVQAEALNGVLIHWEINKWPFVCQLATEATICKLNAVQSIQCFARSFLRRLALRFSIQLTNDTHCQLRFAHARAWMLWSFAPLHRVRFDVHLTRRLLLLVSEPTSHSHWMEAIRVLAMDTQPLLVAAMTTSFDTEIDVEEMELPAFCALTRTMSRLRSMQKRSQPPSPKSPKSPKSPVRRASTSPDQLTVQDALETASVEDAQYLMDHGVDWSAVIDAKHQRTALHQLTFCRENFRYRLEFLEFLVLKAHVDANASDLHGNTPLHLFASNGQLGLLKRLIAMGGDIREVNAMGQTLLHVACEQDQVEVVGFLQSLVAKDSSLVGILHGKDENGCSPLHIMAQQGFVECARTLLADLDDDLMVQLLTQTDSQGRTALHHSVTASQVDMTELLLQCSARSMVLVNRCDHLRRFPLHLAVETTQAVQLIGLLLAYGAPVDAVDERGDTALHWAAFTGREAVVQALVRHGADVTIANSDYETPAQIAAAYGHAGVMRLLMQQNHQNPPQSPPSPSKMKKKASHKGEYWEELHQEVQLVEESGHFSSEEED